MSSPRVQELFDRGREANAAGRPGEGERLLRQAMAQVDRAGGSAAGSLEAVTGGPADVEEVRIRLLLSLSTSTVERRGPGAAGELAAQALRIARDRADRPGSGALLAMCHSQLAMIHGRAGDPGAALAEFQAASATADALGPRERFTILMLQGLLHLEQPDPDRAAHVLEEAADLAADHGLEQQEFMARHNLGLAAYVAGDLAQALTLMRAADRIPADVSRAVAWHGRARVLMEAGLVEEAVELLTRATAAAEQDGQRLVAGQTLIDLAACQLMLGHPELAVPLARRARASLGRRLAPGLRRQAELVLLSARRRAGSGLARVAESARRLAVEFDAAGDVVAADEARVVAAEALMALGRSEDALSTLAATARRSRLSSLSSRLRVRSVRIAAARRAGHPAQARRHLRAALSDVEVALGYSASLDLRAALLVHAQELAGTDLETAGARALDRLVSVERWREIATRTPSVRRPSEPGLARRVAELRALRQQARDDPEQAGATAEQVSRLEREVAEASWSARSGAHTVTGGTAHRAAASGGRAPVTSRDAVRLRERLLEQRSSLASYAVAAGRLGAVVVDRRSTRWVDLCPVETVLEATRRLTADLEARCRVGDGPLLRPVESALRGSLARLDDLLLGPLQLEGRLLVVPTPALSALPWGMLPSRRGSPTTIAPSLTSWGQRATEIDDPSVLALTGPGLPLATREVTAVAAAWDDPIRVGRDGDGADHRAGPHATAEQLTRALVEHDVVHVAAHGSHRSESPIFSSLWLADGPVSLADLEQEQHGASHVVVSACDAGRSRSRGGAALGLASGLLGLGASSVVASVCRVPDETAADLMPRYHALLSAGLPVDESLAAAVEACELPLAGSFVAWGSPWRRTVPATGCGRS